MVQTGIALSLPDVSRNEISAERTDMPEGIKAIHVPHFDISAVMNAASLMRGPVYMVQIEADDIPAELMGFAHNLRQEIGYFEHETQIFEPKNSGRSTYGNIARDLKGFFENTLMQRTSKPENKELLREWLKVLQVMPRAAEAVWPDAYTGLWVFGNGRTDHGEGLTPHFHKHSALHVPMTARILPGYFMNYGPSYTGTVFEDSPNDYWYAKGNSVTIQITDGHFRAKNRLHASPDQFTSPVPHEKRATSVMQIYPSR